MQSSLYFHETPRFVTLCFPNACGVVSACGVIESHLNSDGCRKVSQMYKDLARKTIDSVPCTALSLDAMQVSMNLALRELVLGDIQSSQAMLEEAIQIGELYGNIQGVDQARLLLAVVLYMRGDFKAGAALCDTVIASGEEVGDMKTVVRCMEIRPIVL